MLTFLNCVMVKIQFTALSIPFPHIDFCSFFYCGGEGWEGVERTL